ncbi:MAG: hypothetical protein AVDCRST_MAG30-4624 [uncultured Solirubrobacteraceae bacterium]|uniref:Uncharacterized protein n=1 Tax=uncultured Solirubrobacteraceae bacterium TaxID=1162706 RepID=A0A6J4U4N5_9ACTN|nr:MAG: hypothetical protein AVDCRST_MAG30-4624 [uncultured Solirubrobacteraceae bacterium]
MGHGEGPAALARRRPQGLALAAHGHGREPHAREAPRQPLHDVDLLLAALRARRDEGQRHRAAVREPAGVQDVGQPDLAGGAPHLVARPARHVRVAELALAAARRGGERRRERRQRLAHLHPTRPGRVGRDGVERHVGQPEDADHADDPGEARRARGGPRRAGIERRGSGRLVRRGNRPLGRIGVATPERSLRAHVRQRTRLAPFTRR